MRDLSLHLLDILENSAKAGATRVVAGVSLENDILTFSVQDNGPGLPAPVAADPTHPYCTTRTERPVGLGLALLRAAAEATGGSVTVAGAAGRGVRVEAVFHLGHVDARPLGDLVGALVTAAVGWPYDLVVELGRPPGVVLDMAEVRRALDGVSLAHPSVRRWLEQALGEALAPLQEQAAGVAFGGTR
ncbi:MAG: ATP-binding protein [Lentisphaeria bacterium]|nr:ATP-binding protein [Lentisphaeria bacterium]